MYRESGPGGFGLFWGLRFRLWGFSRALIDSKGVRFRVLTAS